MNADQLNQVANLLNTTDKNAVFSACIMTLVNDGVSVKDAIDAVLGDGTFKKMASDIYNKLNA